MKKQITVHAGDKARFNNRSDVCVGTGRIDLALHREYQDQLRAVQEKCHFKMIRGHGLFSDQMGIYQAFTGPDGVKRTWYCFTYLDRVMDAWLENGLKPFLETGFMPAAMTDSPNTLFYWNAHTAPPREMREWTDLVQATLKHLIQRYGKAEVESWPCEIWNEPNLRGFWENADKAKYLELYRATVTAIKETLPAMRVRGLMAMAPAHDIDAARRTFSGLRELRDELAARSGLALSVLSCGMSDDFPIAVEEGSTIVRLGRTVFDPSYVLG